MRFAAPVLSVLGAGPAVAASLTVTVELPRFDVATYRRPYVAMWLEKPDGAIAVNLAVWYDTRLKEREGEKWLKDIRQWWRLIGRDLTLPADGVSGPTRAPGVAKLTFAGGAAPLGALAPGDYTLVIEAAREHGGREIVRAPFTWPAAANVEVRGESELGAVKVEIK